jgi:hypothetical protein
MVELRLPPPNQSSSKHSGARASVTGSNAADTVATAPLSPTFHTPIQVTVILATKLLPVVSCCGQVHEPPAQALPPLRPTAQLLPPASPSAEMQQFLRLENSHQQQHFQEQQQQLIDQQSGQQPRQSLSQPRQSLSQQQQQLQSLSQQQQQLQSLSQQQQQQPVQASYTVVADLSFQAAVLAQKVRTRDTRRLFVFHFRMLDLSLPQIR